MPSSSLSGRRLGPYDVGPLIGAGGMGEVYRARDTRLNRDVAIKVLLSAVADDGERLARFNREAQVLASLNHPNIAQIYGVEPGPNGPLLILEFVDGPTLADRIVQGPIAFDEAIAIARHVADALEAAHERGIVHRDLKPANIKVSDDGAVKVLDFGLAKAIDPSGDGTMANSPTITSPAMTQAGLILGTAAYMSPEQARGRVVDKRTDLWAFGCVLFEMLTGKRAFEGEDVTDVIAAIVRGEPDWNALPKDADPQLRLLLKRCLEKDRRARIGDISVARFLMNERIPARLTPLAPADATARFRMLLIVAASVIGGLLIGGGAALQLLPRPAIPQLRRFEIVVPSARLAAPTAANDRSFTISPDGTRIVYRAVLSPSQPVQLFMRSIDSLDAQPLAGTSGARSPFFSPDSHAVAFFAGDELRRVTVDGGAPTTICKLESAPRGGYWVDDGTIVFATVSQGLVRVPEGGGQPVQLLPSDSNTLAVQRFPMVLPGAQAVLFTSGIQETSQVEVLDLKTHQRKVLIKGATDAVYTKTGHLVFAMASNRNAESSTGSLRAVRFDAARLEMTSDQVPVVDEVPIFNSGVADYALSSEGTLVVSSTGVSPSSDQRRSLVWVNRRGVEEPLGADEKEYAVARISPDGLRVALDVRDAGNDIGIWDIRRKNLTMLNRDQAQDMSPLWTRDGTRIIWTSTRGGGNPNVYWQMADGAGRPERISESVNNQFPTSMTPDGSQLLYFGGGPGSNRMDLYVLPLAPGDRKPQPLIHTTAMELDAELSPDGRWLAYHANDSGTSHVFVRSYPNVDAFRTQISRTGGTRPAWSRTGRELFYLDENGMLTSVAIQTKGDVFSATPPERVLNARYYAGSTALGLDLRGYDVAPDGQRFLMIKEPGPTGSAQPMAQVRMIVTLNWFTELNKRLPAK